MTNFSKRRLGRTGLFVSEIGLGGAWLLGKQGDRPFEKGAEIVRQALAHGINYIDTAECYGESEQAIGLALEGYEGDVILATKFGHIPRDFDFSRDAVLTSVRRSQERLRFHPIDLLQLHTPAEPEGERIFGPNGALAGMREARERGWCRFLGITGNDIDFLRRCLDTDCFDTMLVFMRYDLLDQSGAALIAEAAARDIGVLLGSPLRMGLFTNGEKRALSPEESPDRVRELEARFKDEPGGIMAAAMRFALANPAVASVLSGVGSLSELDVLLRHFAAP